VASDDSLRSVRLPSPPEVVELLAEAFARDGCVIEDVAVEARSRPPRLVVTVDGDDDHDDGLDLDVLAELSRAASELLDASDGGSDPYDPYVLEVSSRGVDKPLTAPRHFRRAQGRKIDLTLSDGARVEGRLGALDGQTVTVVVPGRPRGTFDVRSLALSEITKAVVQVEFSQPNRREIELAGLSGEEADE
jgi:ribosome maturation factor RimP